MKPSPYLVSRRKAAYTLNQLCKELKLGTMAEHFDPEQPSEWDNVGESIVLAKRYGRTIAELELLGSGKVHLTIPMWSGLIRTEHLSKFDPAHFGLQVNNAMDIFLLNKHPDSIGEVDFGEPIGLELPPHPTIRKTRRRALQVNL